MDNPSLQERAMLVDLTIKKWTASKHDKSVSQEVALNHGSDCAMGRYQKLLVSKMALETINQIATEANQEHRKRTLPWSEGGVRILSSAGYMDYAAAMRHLQAEWEIAVNDFCANYDRYVKDAQRRLGTLFKDSEYPSSASIHNKFAFSYDVLPLPSGNDFRVQLGTDEVKRLRGAIEANVQQSVKLATRDVVARVVDVAGHMAERLNAYDPAGDKVTGKFHDTLVSNVRELAALLPSLNIADDPAIREAADRMQSLCEHDPQTLRDDKTKRQETAAKAEEIVNKLADFLG